MNTLQFSITTDALRKHLAKVMPAVPGKTTLPVLEHLMLTAESGKIYLTGTDLELTITTTADADVTEGGSALIPARKFSEILKSLPASGSVTVSVCEKYKITLKTTAGQYSMMGMNADDFPELPDLDISSGVVIEAGDMSSIVANTAFAVSKDADRPAMTGISLTFDGDTCEAAATDSFRLSRVRVGLSAKATETAQIIVPVATMNLLAHAEGDVVVGIAKTHVQFSVGDITVIKSRLIEDRFPPYNTIIPLDNTIELRVNTHELLAAIRRVALFANGESRQIMLSITEKNITLSGADDESGSSAHETVEWLEFNHTNFVIGFNHVYLTEALQHMHYGDKYHLTTMKFSAPNRAAILQHSADDESILMLIMPVRL